MQTAAPVKNNEREIFMDVLRGFAILGIFIANLRSFSWWQSSNANPGTFLLPLWDQRMFFLHHLFIEGKFYSIFSFLFGWGIALQLQRSQSVSGKPLSLIRRRLVIMLLLGAVHLLLWPGDIVFFYALVGFLLLLFLKLTDRTLLITGVIFLIAPILLYGLKMHVALINAPAQGMFMLGDLVDEKITGITGEAAFKQYMEQAGWFDIIKADIAGFFYRYADLFFQSRIFKVLGMMMIGVAFGRSNFYKNVSQHKKLLNYIIATGILVGVPANYLLARYLQTGDAGYYNLQLSGFYRTIAYAAGVAPLAAAYIAILIRLFQTRTGKSGLTILAPVGKMAFTNYITHTLVGSVVFYNAGLGFMREVGPVYYTIFAFMIFGLQIIFSTAWLQYFNYGPVEWLWRSGTYRRWQPMKRNKTLPTEK